MIEKAYGPQLADQALLIGNFGGDLKMNQLNLLHKHMIKMVSQSNPIKPALDQVALMDFASKINDLNGA